MPIPLLEYAPSCNNQRVDGFEVSGDEKPKIYSTDDILSATDMDNLIGAAYRQIFFHAFKADREIALESQLRNGQITVREFIRGLCLSKTFTGSFYNLNSNYRFVEHCVEKLLGRAVYSKQEKIAWSIVIATKGRAGLINDLLNSPEYLENFGENIVPYQRRRTLPSGAVSELPFNIKSPRYDEYYRGKFGFPRFVWQAEVRSYASTAGYGKAGDPSMFMGMARSLSPVASSGKNVSTYDLDYERLVPRR